MVLEVGCGSVLGMFAGCGGEFVGVWEQVRLRIWGTFEELFSHARGCGRDSHVKDSTRCEGRHCWLAESIRCEYVLLVSLSRVRFHDLSLLWQRQTYER